MITNINPKASVILPVYNAEKYIRTAVESILQQSFKDFELLLLNDGSSDSSLEYMNNFAQNDNRCKIYSWPNKGLIETLNAGIQLSRGEIIFRMDADDICHPNRFEKQLAYLNEHINCVAIGTRVMLIDPEGLPICKFNSEINHYEIDNAHLSGKGGAIIHPSVAIRKSALEYIGGYRHGMLHAEDIDLFLRLAEVGTVANLPEVLLEYRQHLGSIGYKHRETQISSTKKAVVEALKRRQLNEQIEEYGSNITKSKQVTTSDIYRKWAWWSLGGGNIDTAKKYALKAIKEKVFSLDNLKLLVCVLRGR